jgi:hypothetical protein
MELDQSIQTVFYKYHAPTELVSKFSKIFMPKKKQKRDAKDSSKPEKISAEESLQRMKTFSERKEKIIANIRESKN